MGLMQGLGANYEAVLAACPYNEKPTFLLSQLSTAVVAVLRCAACTFKTQQTLPSDSCHPKTCSPLVSGVTRLIFISYHALDSSRLSTLAVWGEQGREKAAAQSR